MQRTQRGRTHGVLLVGMHGFIARHRRIPDDPLPADHGRHWRVAGPLIALNIALNQHTREENQAMKTPLITMPLYHQAMEKGYRIDIGMPQEHRKEFERKAKRGEVIKCRGYWPNLIQGCSPLKTIFINH